MERTRVKKVDVFRYTDARAYLRRCRDAVRVHGPLSYAFLARRTGVNKGIIWGALRGRKSFPRAMAEKLPALLGLGKREAEYLRVLLLLSDSDIDDPLRASIIRRFRPAAYRKGRKRPR
jgi:hypothetical protein